MSLVSHRIAADGADLYVEERGDGDPLLLLHGFAGCGADWNHLFDLDALAHDRRLLIPDARGHGRSTNPSGVFSFRQCGRDVATILDHLHVKRLSAIGLSLGAKTLLHVATEFPTLLCRMILVSATPRFPEATRKLFRESAAMQHSPQEWERMRTMHVHGDDQTRALWQLPARFGEDPTDMSFAGDQLRRIEARTLLVAGDRDPLYPVELATELYRGIRASSLWVVPDGGHLPVFEPEQRANFGRHALTFLSSRLMQPAKTLG